MNSNLLKKTIQISLIFIMVLICAGSVVNIAEARGKTTKPKTCRYTHMCYYTIVKDSITYDVAGSATYSRTCGNNSFPSWGCDFVKSEIIDRIGPAALSATWGLSCGNVHAYNATINGTSGKCGSATTSPTSVAPTQNLCEIGASSAVSSNSTTFDWTCSGISGGASVSCSAPRATGFDLSCTPNPTTGVAGQSVVFTAGISGTTTPANQFTFTWNVNGVDYSDDDTFSNTFAVATNTAKVTVKAVRGNAESTVQCPFNRVDCAAPNTYYCGDVVSPTSHSCAPGPTSCPVSYCGTSASSPIYSATGDKQLAAGGGLQTTTPTDGYISSNLLCAAGSLLRTTSDGSTWNFSAGYSSWKWDCKNPEAFTHTSCKARCMTGEYYCFTQQKCIPESVRCDCTLPDNPAAVDQRQYCVDDGGSCYTCGKVINYFKLNPDEIPKNQTQKLCGGFWSTRDIAFKEKPTGTAITRVICEMKSGNTTTPVPANNLEGNPGYSLNIGTHALTCTQQYSFTDPNPIWLNLQSSSIDAKCRALPAVSEN